MKFKKFKNFGRTPHKKPPIPILSFLSSLLVLELPHGKFFFFISFFLFFSPEFSLSLLPYLWRVTVHTLLPPAVDMHRTSVFPSHQHHPISRPSLRRSETATKGGSWSQGAPRLPSAFSSDLTFGSSGFHHQSNGLELFYKPMPRLLTKVHVFLVSHHGAIWAITVLMVQNSFLWYIICLCLVSFVKSHIF